jgi:hypothetical protein
MIYIDPLFAWPMKAKSGARHFGNGKQSCHMGTDGDMEELHLFAESIGLKRTWFQPHATLPHYDLTPAKRELARAKGAQSVSQTAWVTLCRHLSSPVPSQPAESMV